MSARNIRGFLLQKPKPIVVRVTTGGEVQDVKPGNSYAKCADTIDALDGDLVECLDADGRLLRAMKLNDFEAKRIEPTVVPTGLEADPQALLLTHFANLVARAYEHSTEVAFGKMVELVERMNDRAESIEQRLERAESANRRLHDERVEEAFERAEQVAAQVPEAGGDLVQNLASAFLSGQLQSQSAPNGKPRKAE